MRPGTVSAPPGTSPPSSIQLVAPGVGRHRKDRQRAGPLRRLVGDQRRRSLVGGRRTSVEHGERRPRDALEQAPLHVGESGGAPRQVCEHRGGRLGVGQRPVGARLQPELLDEDGQRVPVELGVEQQRGVERVEPVRDERRRAGAPRRRGQVFPVERRVVPDEDRVAGELAQAGERLRGSRGAGDVRVRDAREPGDEQRDRHAGVDQCREPSGDGEVFVQAHGADVDDAVGERVEAGGLGVDDHELGARTGHAPRIAEGRRAGRRLRALRGDVRRGRSGWPRRPWSRRGRGARPDRRRRRRPASG